MDFIVATKNKDKLVEIRDILADLPFHIIGMEEAGVHLDIDENASTFEGNALIKAQALHNVVDGYCMADDSGLCIDALDGAPGIYSARFFGRDSSYEEKIGELWRLLKDVPYEKRTAQFVCAIAVVAPDGTHFTVKEKVEGIIIDEMRGENGFGYDPVFYVPSLGKTTAEIPEEEKNQISHRGLALRAMLDKLKQA